MYRALTRIKQPTSFGGGGCFFIGKGRVAQTRCLAIVGLTDLPAGPPNFRTDTRSECSGVYAFGNW